MSKETGYAGADFDQLVTFMESPSFGFILDRASKNAIEHVLLRLGIDATAPTGVQDMQRAMAWVREASEEWGPLTKRVGDLEAKMNTHLETCETNQQKILAELELRKKGQRWIRMRMDAFLIAAFLMACGAIGYLLTHEVVVVVRP